MLKRKGAGEGKESKMKKRKSSKGDAETSEEVAVTPKIDSLKLFNIQEDMKLLGCVRKVTGFAIHVEIPGGIEGRMHLTSISRQFNQELEKRLQNNQSEGLNDFMRTFQPGQFLPLIVKDKPQDGKISLILSTDPKDINTGFDHISIAKNKLLWAAVESHLDHGYVLDAGIANCRIFLPHTNMDNDSELCVGIPMWCEIIKSNVSATASTLTVSIKKEHFSKVVERNINLHFLVPGMQVDFYIVEITSKGMIGNIFENCTAFISSIDYNKPLELNKTYKEGDTVKARVLYVEPHTNAVYLSLKRIDEIVSPDVEIGGKFKAKVISKADNGLYIKLDGKHYGFVTNRRILNELDKKNQGNLAELMKTKYRKNSAHMCRVLDFSYMRNVYVCTFEAKFLKESLFTWKDATVGQKVSVRIKEIKPGGLIVSFGHLSGFVPNLHLSNVQYSENIKRKYSEGQNLSARILSIEENGNIILTLKPAFVDNDSCLTDVKNVEINKDYPGMVMKCNEYGVSVAFYNNIVGYVEKRFIPEADGSAESLFYRGQVIMTRVLNKPKEDLLQLSLLPLNQEASSRKDPRKIIFNLDQVTDGKDPRKIIFNLGQVTDGVVSEIMPTKGINVTIASDEGSLQGFIPISHLGVNMELNQSLLATYKIGDEIKKMICILVRNERPIFSLTERGRFTASRFKKIEPNSLIRCYFSEKFENGISVYLPTPDFFGEIVIPDKLVCEKRATFRGTCFHHYQAFEARVLEIDHKAKKISLSVRLSHVFDCDYESVLLYAERYMSDVMKIKEHAQISGEALGNLNLGQRVKCVVKKVGKTGGCSVVLPDFNNLQGLVDVCHCPKNVKPQQIVEGVVLWVDFVLRYAEISFKALEVVNETQNARIKNLKRNTAQGKVLLLRNNYFLAALKHNNNAQLVILPVYLHENDLAGLKLYYTSAYGYMSGIKMSVKRRPTFTVGFDKKLKRKFSKFHKDDTEMLESGRKIRPGRKGDKIKVEDDDANAGAEDLKDSVKIKLEEAENEKGEDDEEKPLLLPGAFDYYKLDEDIKEESESSDDEDEENSKPKKKKKKQTQEENKLRNETPDLNENPKSADYFERLLKLKPNSAEIWTRYVAFHLTVAEIEKARAIARRALETIEFREINEKYNVWVAFLNLENKWGTKETFEAVFEEAARCNDPVKIYVQTVKMLAECGKLDEMEEKIKVLCKKFKDQFNMWVEVMKIYYINNRLSNGRQIKDKALLSITNKKQQIDLLVQSALLEFQHAPNEQQGEAIFENIIGAHPQRVDVWSTYVDQLIKAQKIDSARRVLERSVCQKLPAMKMKALFKKFLNFEKAHGDEESLAHVKRMAEDYVAK